MIDFQNGRYVMDKTDIERLIADTAHKTAQAMADALLLKNMLKNQNLTAYEKTEMLLRAYPSFKGVDEPTAQRVVREVDACLEEAAGDPYVDTIRLFYFGGLKNAACADVLCCDERTCRRNRVELVKRFSVRLASAEFIREIMA